MNEDVFLSFPILETDRLALIRHHEKHAADMFDLRTDKDVMLYLDTYPPKTLADIKNKIKKNISNFDDKLGINWIITVKGFEEAIGYMGVWKIDKHNNRGEIGYALKKKYWNKGYASEAAKAVINFAFISMNLNTIMANTNPKNTSSQALLNKLGFIKEAHFRQDYFFDGKYLDSAIYGLIKEDWHY